MTSIPRRKIAKSDEVEQRSSRWPFHPASAEDVDVNVTHGLAPIDALVQDQSVPSFGQSELSGYLGSEAKQVARGRLGCRRLEIRRASQMFQRYREYMGWSLGTDVVKRECAIGPLYDLGGYVSRDDPAEQAIAHPNLLGR
jgi:hypothetical protein